ncbi:hypothetical protein BN946_scf184599.g4 [Trametes cinnabarina]|uniref:ferric-chelate reductase (NADPH) n=1 Tax=Pycnoporus cinnabarinus TaxID=5643 RepID=A0A060SK71_PYCCI|nr:hypothetical protein BN946_scf184599.g4 [Trametes cinnabarina]
MPSATPTSSATPLPAYPSTPDYPDDLEFITAYLTVHVLSDASRIYSYIFWIVLALVLIFFSLLHHLHLRAGYLGALWTKWTVRRRTWRKKHSLAIARAKAQPHTQPFSFPSNAQIFTLVAIILAALALSFAGPDYLAPGSTLWTLHNFPSATANLAKRAYDTSLFAQYQPHYTINKAWWTSGNRTGLIAFALFPLCTLFALKSPPFAVFSLPCLVQIYCDKLLWLHKWTARLIYLLTVLHVAFWSVQLCIERRPSTGRIAYVYAWQYEKFLYAWIAFGCMTLLFLLSIAPIRRAHYEAFWFLHVLLVPLTLIMSALHHPPVWWWCWAALGLWLGERTWRFTWWLYTNGILSSNAAAVSTQPSDPSAPYAGLDRKIESPYPPKFKGSPPDTPPSSSTLAFAQYPPSTSVKLMPGAGLSLPTDYIPPPGFAHAELLPGRTVRLRIVTPGYLTWAPGQHFLISIPSITRFTTHPFTAASICDEQNPRADGRVLVFIIRAKAGWTKDLWDTVALMIGRGQQFQKGEALPRCAMPSRGVLLRACVDGPYGSSVRAKWNDYSTVVVVAGGSGVSYALSVLQYLCLCLAGRDGRFLGGTSGGYGQSGFKITRVRFVWLVREFVVRISTTTMHGPGASSRAASRHLCHKRETYPGCRSRAPADADIVRAPSEGKHQEFERPNPGFAQESRPQSRASTVSSEESGEDSDVDLSYYIGSYVEEDGELGHEEHVLDLTNFEGDDDSELPGEAQFNMSVRREGRMRRRNTRRMSMALLAKQELAYPREQAGVAPAH